MSESTVDEQSDDRAETPEMSEPKNNSFQSWALPVMGVLMAMAISAGITKATSDSAHFAKLDTIIEENSKAQEARDGKLDRIGEKLDALPRNDSLVAQFSAMNSRIQNNETNNHSQDERITALQQTVHDNRIAADNRFESIASELKIHTTRQWGIFNMDRWISAAEKKIGKPLPTVQDVTGKEPGQP